MNIHGPGRIQTSLLGALLVLGLALAIGCQSAPADDDPPPAQPIEEYDETQDPYGEPEDDPYGEPAPTEPDPAQPGTAPQQQGDPMVPQQGEAQEIDDEKLDEFVDAFIETQEFGEEVEQRMQQAETYEEMEQIQQQAMVELEEHVEATGMDFNEFLMIAQQLERDPALQQRVQTKLQERGVTVH